MARIAKNHEVNWKKAPDIKKRITILTKTLNLDWIKIQRIYCFRSNYSSSRAYARIWGLSRIWQKALGQSPAYIIEVLSEHFDKLGSREQDKVLLHEITHIPKNFSGSLLPHIRRRGARNFNSKVEQLISRYLKNNLNKN